MSSASAEAILKGCILFSGLSDADLAQIANLAVERSCDPGTAMFSEGEKAREILVLKEGRIAVQMTLPTPVSQPPRRITVDIVGSGEVIGWSALVEPYLYTLTAVCLQKASVLAIDGDRLRALLQQKAEAGYQVLKGLISVVASRLEDTRQVLISERLLNGERQEGAARRASRV